MFIKKKSSHGEQAAHVMPRESYISEKGMKIISPKYTSFFAESDRVKKFNHQIALNYEFGYSRRFFLALLCSWLESKTPYSNFSHFFLGMSLSPVIQGSKVKILVTGLLETDEKLQITFFHEGKTELTWTTFSLIKGRFFSKKFYIRFDQEVFFNEIQESLSPQGSYARLELRKSFRRVREELEKQASKIKRTLPKNLSNKEVKE